MKRIALMVLAGLTISLSNAQEVKDTVFTMGNTMDVYYSMNDGAVGSAIRNNWDIAFENLGFTASVLINGQKGVSLYSSPYTVDQWSSFDSTGYAAWPSTINSLESWSSGAFNQNLSNDFDLGWGTYNVSTHIISGDSIFFIGLEDGSFRKLYIDELAAGEYTFVYANIDGSNEKKVSIKKNDIGAQNFGFYSIENDKLVEREPDTETWDVVFTQYLSPVPVGGGEFQNYPVSGVKINKYVQVAQRDGQAVSSNDTNGLNWNTNLTEIGSDWKSWNGTAYEYEENRVYFVKLDGGQMWKLYFTKYEGGPSGNYHLVKEKIASGVSVNEVVDSQVSLYPNPSTHKNVIVALANNTELVNIQIYNSAMQLISSQTDAVINASVLASGMYFISVQTTDGTAVKPLVIN